MSRAKAIQAFLRIIAEAERFELSIPFGMLPFQGSGINRYPTPPNQTVHVLYTKTRA